MHYDRKRSGELWKTWNSDSPVPKVDFQKEIVIVGMTVGSGITLLPSLTNEGNLTLGGEITSDLRPGFRYLIATVSREGVKMVNGKPLPTE